ncbi:MAG: hypothetical protein KBT31_02795 [Firmicutes bacterium]|nr:hypothetical protein [Candidatus Colimorpha enterica]
MKHFIAILMAAIMMVSCAYLCFAEESNEIQVTFDDGDLDIFGFGQGLVIPEIVDRADQAGKCVRFYNSVENAAANLFNRDEEGKRIDGGSDGYLDWNDCTLTETYGQELVIELEFKVDNMDGVDWTKYEGEKIFQFQVKSYASDGSFSWYNNYQPVLVKINNGAPALTANYADKAYAFEWGRWYDVAFAFDFVNKTITGFVDGNKAYTAELDPDGKDIISYHKMMFGQPDKHEHPFDYSMDNVRIFAGTKPKKQASGDIGEEVDVDTGDVTAVVALVAILACGTGIIASKKH